MTETVRAVRRGQRLELLEPLNLPEGLEVAITVELPAATRPAARLGKLTMSGSCKRF